MTDIAFMQRPHEDRQTTISFVWRDPLNNRTEHFIYYSDVEIPWHRIKGAVGIAEKILETRRDSAAVCTYLNHCLQRIESEVKKQ